MAKPALIGIDRLSRQEQAACLIAVRTLDASRAEAWDVDGRQNAVDVMLTLADGRTAAFEVTNLAADGALETASLLARDNHKWPVPGMWFWSIDVGSPQDLRRLRQCYQKIILICEADGIAYPQQHPSVWTPAVDPDLQWLVEHSSCTMVGHPEQLASTMQNPGAMVVPVVGSGFIDESLSGFANELRTAFNAPHIPPHFAKLASAVADERHLFIPLHASALPFRISSVLMFEDALPAEPPPVPAHITYLWLAPEYSRRVLLWSRLHGWRNHFPYATGP
ncbi:hypothetical protein [Mycobacterium sp. Lab-001]|uniref:hypothetical protein n=1 Tax=Mycobacterium sp. Lab-001 TaxID=3410136 RepID=UPI003D166A09